MKTFPLLALAAGLAGCAAGPDTRTMGAAPACDLRIETRNGAWCEVRRVTPPDTDTLLTESMRDFENRTGPR